MAMTFRDFTQMILDKQENILKSLIDDEFVELTNLTDSIKELSSPFHYGNGILGNYQEDLRKIYRIVPKVEQSLRKLEDYFVEWHSNTEEEEYDENNDVIDRLQIMINAIELLLDVRKDDQLSKKLVELKAEVEKELQFKIANDEKVIVDQFNKIIELVSKTDTIFEIPYDHTNYMHIVVAAYFYHMNDYRKGKVQS